MKITNGIVEVDIDDDKAVYSPFLRVVMDNLDSGLFDVDLLEEAVLIDRVDGDVLKNFIYFLEEGVVLEMEDEDEEFYDYMGFPNTYEYPYSYWKVKLRDNWIRDNMYRLGLWEQDKYYGLVEVPILRDRLEAYETRIGEYFLPRINDNLGTNLIVAGGAALFLSGAIEKLKDIDLFFLSGETDSLRLIREFVEEDASRISLSESAITLDSKIQLIFRLYKSPTEIVHGFDLDSVGILYDGERLWATERTMYAIRERFNWFDPTRASPSYTSRLLKYHLRGFRVMLPGLIIQRVNKGNVTEDIDRLMKKYLAMGSDYSEYPREMVNSVQFKAVIRDLALQDIATTNIVNSLPISGREAESIRRSIVMTQRAYMSVADNIIDTAHDIGDQVIPSVRRYLYMYNGNDPSLYGTIVDMTDIIEEGFDLISNILRLGERMNANDYPFIRDDLALIYRGGYNQGQMVGVISRVVGKRVRDVLPAKILSEYRHLSLAMYEDPFLTDDASLLILAYVYDIVYMNKDVSSRSDYLGSTTHVTPDVLRIDGIDYKSIKFNRQDPMTQVTSTFNPEPIEDIEEFYQSSHYYGGLDRRPIFEPLISYE